MKSAFDVIVCTAAFKNFREPVKSLNEMYRVLKPKGRAWIDDLKHDISNDSINDLVKNTMKARGFSSLFMKWTFKSFLRKSAYTKEQFIRLISTSGFNMYEISENPTEYEILLTK